MGSSGAMALLPCPSAAQRAARLVVVLLAATALVEALWINFSWPWKPPRTVGFGLFVLVASNLATVYHPNSDVELLILVEKMSRRQESRKITILLFKNGNLIFFLAGGRPDHLPD